LRGGIGTEDKGTHTRPVPAVSPPLTEEERAALARKRVFNELMESDDDGLAGDAKRYMKAVSRKSM